MAFQTTEAYISGGICGAIWMPYGAKCGKPLRVNIRREFDRFSEPASFRDVLLSIQTHEGGDFQAPYFTVDTVLRVVRRRIDGNGRYTLHVREREISQLADCADLVDADSYVGDFLGEE